MGQTKKDLCKLSGIGWLIHPAIFTPICLFSVLAMFYSFAALDMNFGIGMGLIFLYIILNVVFLCQGNKSWNYFFLIATIVIFTLLADCIIYLPRPH